jgi:nucleoid-associated protein YgaU
MSDETQFEDEPYHGTQILWGRVVVLLFALALAFWLGTTFGGDASTRSRLADQRAEITRLESEIAALEEQVAAVDAGGSPPEDAAAASEPSGGDGDEGGDADQDSDDTETEPAEDTGGDGNEYVIQSGDSLASIAQEVYGDPTLWRQIAQANDLSEPYALTVGDTLDIPEQP